MDAIEKPTAKKLFDQLNTDLFFDAEAEEEAIAEATANAIKEAEAAAELEARAAVPEESTEATISDVIAKARARAKAKVEAAAKARAISNVEEGEMLGGQEGQQGFANTVMHRIHESVQGILGGLTAGEIASKRWESLEKGFESRWWSIGVAAIILLRNIDW